MKASTIFSGTIGVYWFKPALGLKDGAISTNAAQIMTAMQNFALNAELICQ